MKLMVIGSKSIKDYDFSRYIFPDVDLIICADESSTDALAEKYADERNISKMILKPDYERYENLAPLARNLYMVDLCDSVLAIWDGNSFDVGEVIKAAKRKNKHLTIIIPEYVGTRKIFLFN